MPRIPIVALILLAVLAAAWHARAPSPCTPARPSPAVAPTLGTPAAALQETVVAREAHAVDAPAETTLEILVRTDKGISKNRVPIAGIDFEVLRLGSEHVELPESLGPQRAYAIGERLSVGETDGAGLARVSLPAGIALDELGSPSVLVRVIEPGHQQQTARAYVPREGGLPTARPAVVAGATARGRVVDADGSPVLARVRAERWIEDNRGGRRLRSQAASTPLPDGRFELHLREDLFDVLLLAEAEGHGTAARVDVDLPLADPPQDLELVVAGAGALRGRVEGHDGRPLGGLALLARLAEIDGGPLDAAEPLASLRRAQGRGRIEIPLTTDATGRFELRGLRAEPYVVRANLEHDRAYGYGTLLTDRPVLAVDAEVVLRVAQPQLVVRLLDAEGEPWTGAPLRLDRGMIGFPKGGGWTKEPHILVHPLAAAGGRSDVSGESLAGRRIGDHMASFSVDAGASFLISVQGEDFTAPPIATDFPPGSARVDVDVRASPARGWGTLIPRVLKAPADVRSTTVDVFLEEPLTGLRLCDFESRRDGPDRLRVPQGRYRLVVEGGANVDFHHGTLFGERAHGRAEVELDVRADAQVEVPIELGLGARIDLELAGEPDSGDRAAVARAMPWMLEPTNVARLPELVASATVVLRRSQRGIEPVFRVVEFTGGSAAGKHLQPGWPLGLRDTSQVVSPGTWTLVARLPGGREVATQVVLRAGETTPVRLEFDD